MNSLLLGQLPSQYQVDGLHLQEAFIGNVDARRPVRQEGLAFRVFINFPFNPCIGFIYAARHFAIASKCESTALAWGHRIIGLIDAFPPLSYIAAMIEYLIVLNKDKQKAIASIVCGAVAPRSLEDCSSPEYLERIEQALTAFEKLIDSKSDSLEIDVTPILEQFLKSLKKANVYRECHNYQTGGEIPIPTDELINAVKAKQAAIVRLLGKMVTPRDPSDCLKPEFLKRVENAIKIFATLLDLGLEIKTIELPSLLGSLLNSLKERGLYSEVSGTLTPTKELRDAIQSIEGAITSFLCIMVTPRSCPDGHSDNYAQRLKDAVQIFETLVDLGLDPNALRNDKETQRPTFLLELASHKPEMALLQRVLAKGAKIQPNPSTTKTLLEYVLPMSMSIGFLDGNLLRKIDFYLETLEEEAKAGDESAKAYVETVLATIKKSREVREDDAQEWYYFITLWNELRKASGDGILEKMQDFLRAQEKTLTTPEEWSAYLKGVTDVLKMVLHQQEVLQELGKTPEVLADVANLLRKTFDERFEKAELDDDHYRWLREHMVHVNDPLLLLQYLARFDTYRKAKPSFNLIYTAYPYYYMCKNALDNFMRLCHNEKCFSILIEHFFKEVGNEKREEAIVLLQKVFCDYALKYLDPAQKSLDDPHNEDDGEYKGAIAFIRALTRFVDRETFVKQDLAPLKECLSRRIEGIRYRPLSKADKATLCDQFASAIEALKGILPATSDFKDLESQLTDIRTHLDEAGSEAEPHEFKEGALCLCKAPPVVMELL